MLSLQMQLIKSEAFGTVSVCQCDSSSNNKATSPLATVELKLSATSHSENRKPQETQLRALYLAFVLGLIIP